MAENRTILLSVELDTSHLEKAAKDASEKLTMLREDAKKAAEQHGKDSVEYKKLQVEIQKYNKELNNSVKAIQAAELKQTANTGSLREMRDELANAKLVFASFNKEQRESVEGQQFAESMLDLKNAINDVEATFGTFTGQVGNYEEAIKNALGEQYLMEKSFEDIALSSDTVESKFEQLNQKIAITPKTLNGLNAQMEAYKAIALQAAETDPIRQEAINKAGQLKDQYVDLEREINNVANDQKNLQGAMEIGQVAIASVGLYQSALASLGVEGEEFEEMLIKLQVAQTALSSLQQISIVIQKQSAAAALLQAGASKAQAAAMAISNKVFAEGTVAAKNFSKVLLFSGVGAFLALLTLVVANYDKIKASLFGVNEAQAALNDTMDDYKSGASDAVKKTSEVSAAFKLAEKGVISKEEALQTYNDTLGDAFGKTDNLNEAEKLFRDKTEAYIKATSLRSQAQALFSKAADASAEALAAQLENQIGFFDAASLASDKALLSEEEFNKKLSKQQAKRVAEQQAAEKRRAAIFTGEAEKLLLQAETIENTNGIISESEGKLNEARKQRADEQKKRQEEAIKKAEEVAKRMRELATLELELTLSDERKILEAHYAFIETMAEDNELALIELTKKKNADLRELELKELAQAKKLIEERYTEEINAAENNKELIASLTSAKNAEIESIEIDFNNRFVAREAERIAREQDLAKQRVAIEQQAANDVKLIVAELTLEKTKGTAAEFNAWKALQEERIAALQRFRDAELLIEGKSSSEKEKIQKEAELEIQKIKNETFAQEQANDKKLEDSKRQLALTSIQIAQQVADTIFQIAANRIQEEINLVTGKYDAESELLQSQLDANLISQADFNAQKSKLDADFRAKESKLKKEQFEKEKAAALISATIAAATAVLNALATPPPASFVLAGIAGTLGAAQIGIIASQPTPEFERGGQLKTGVFGGNLHTSGGTKGVFSDGTKVEVERDEAFFILNRKATAAISELSNHNAKHGGVQFANGGTLQFQGGGTFAAATTSRVTQRFQGQNELLQLVKQMPVPVVPVESIIEATSNQINIVSRAEF